MKQETKIHIAYDCTVDNCPICSANESGKPLTDVIFYRELNADEKEQADIVALFPESKYRHPQLGKMFVTCYQHIGQHSDGVPEYFEGLEQATPEEYTPLKEELESLGYNLTILNS